LQKSPTEKQGDFSLLQGGKTQKYREYFKDGNAVKRSNVPIAAHYNLIVLST